MAEIGMFRGTLPAFPLIPRIVSLKPQSALPAADGRRAGVNNQARLFCGTLAPSQRWEDRWRRPPHRKITSRKERKNGLLFEGHKNARRSIRAHAARHLLCGKTDRDGAAKDDRQGRQCRVEG